MRRFDPRMLLVCRSLTVSVRHEIDVNAGRIVVHLSGAVTAAEVLAYYADLAVDPLLRPGLTVLADCREVTAVPSFLELSLVANAQWRTPREVRPTRAAVVVAAAWLFGIARQFGALTERSGIRVMPFYDDTEAREWLAAETPSALVDEGNEGSPVERA
jgi:hypothetical protein